MKLFSGRPPTGISSASLLAFSRWGSLDDLDDPLVTQFELAQRGGFNHTIGKVASGIDGDTVTVLFGTETPDNQGFREWDRNTVVNWARGLGFGIREARRVGATDIVIPGLTMSNAYMAGYIAGSANYEYDAGLLRRPKESGKSGGPIRNVHVDDDSVAEEFQAGLIVAEARNFGRDLMNQPSAVLTTTRLMEAATEMATEQGITCTILDREQMEYEGFDLTLSIAQGSNPLTNPPYVMVLEYFGDPKGPKAPGVVLVGKGVIHDLGGNNMKADCSDMHMDMGGCAEVLATIKAVARLTLPINVRVVVFLVQNAVSRDMTVTGTPIYSHLLDTTVVINNTDAEGRLGLAECVAYAKKRWGTTGEILLGIDVATLTGLQALFFPDMSTVWGNQGDLAWHAHKAGLEVGDRVTVGFLDFDCLQDLQKAGGVYAMGNLGNRKGPGGMRSGGSTVGAEFALQSIGGTIPWLHIDIAGAMEHAADSGEFAKGGDVPNVATLIFILQDLRQFLLNSGASTAT